METKLSSGNTAVRLTTPSGSDAGHIGVYGTDGNQKVFIQGWENRGFIGLNGDDGNQNVWLNGNGFISATRSIQLVVGGQVKLWLDENSKNFIMSHPHDKTKNIIYACIEGPEAAAYIRGKSQLVSGQAEIEFPEHFSLVINPETITIQLTPCSPDSKGLAVVSHSEQGFSVKELWQGQGTYEFGYFVAGVRRGMEHFTPVVDKGLTAFGEPMGAAVSGSSAAPQPASMIQEMSPSTSAQPVEPLSSPAPQGVILENLIPEPPIPVFSSVPSPSAINFEDKKP